MTEAIGRAPRELSQSRIENYRRDLPHAMAAITELVVDNPKSFLLIACADYVIAGAIVNLVKPRGLAGLLACGVVSMALGTVGMAELMKRGIIKIEVRDDDGRLVPLWPSDEK